VTLDSHLAAAFDNDAVAFHADGYDDEIGCVWTLHVVGRVVARGDSDIAIDPKMIEGAWLAF
jgi:hypothetical protein